MRYNNQFFNFYIKHCIKEEINGFSSWNSNLKLMWGLNEDGYPFYVDMTSTWSEELRATKFLDKKEWTVLAATDKVNGKWDYIEI